MFRIEPNMPASSYKTYQILQPIQTHFRDASCQEVDCEAYANGWTTTIDTGTDLGKKQANYIWLHSGRHFAFVQNGTKVTFTFAAGQKCFRQHKVSLERDQIYVVRDGDWRGNPRGTAPRRHSNAADWLDDFADHQARLSKEIENG